MCYSDRPKINYLSENVCKNKVLLSYKNWIRVTKVIGFCSSYKNKREVATTKNKKQKQIFVYVNVKLKQKKSRDWCINVHFFSLFVSTLHLHKQIFFCFFLVQLHALLFVRIPKIYEYIYAIGEGSK